MFGNKTEREKKRLVSQYCLIAQGLSALSLLVMTFAPITSCEINVSLAYGRDKTNPRFSYVRQKRPRQTYRSPVHVVSFRAHSCHARRRPRWHCCLFSRVSLVLIAFLLRNCYLFYLALSRLLSHCLFPRSLSRHCCYASTQESGASLCRSAQKKGFSRRARLGAARRSV